MAKIIQLTPLPPDPSGRYASWKKELITVTAANTGRLASTIVINDIEALKWYNSGATPYQTFRETWEMENDSN